MSEPPEDFLSVSSRSAARRFSLQPQSQSLISDDFGQLQRENNELKRRLLDASQRSASLITQHYIDTENFKAEISDLAESEARLSAQLEAKIAEQQQREQFWQERLRQSQQDEENELLGELDVKIEELSQAESLNRKLQLQITQQADEIRRLRLLLDEAQTNAEETGATARATTGDQVAEEDSKGAVQEMSVELFALRASTATLKQQLADSQKQRVALSAQVTELTASLQQQLQESLHARTEANDRADAAAAELQSSKRTTTALSDELAVLKDELAALKDSDTKAKALLTDALRERDGLKQLHEQTMTMVKQLTSDRSDQSSRLTLVEGELAAARAQVLSAKEAQLTTSHQLTELQRLRDQQTTELQQLREKHTSGNAKRKQLTADNKALSVQLSEKEARLNSVQTAAEKDRAQLDQYRQELAQAQRELGALREAQSALQLEASRSADSLAQLQQERTQLHSQLEAASVALKSSEAELDRLQKAVTDRAADHQKLTGLYRSSLDQVKDLTSSSRAAQDQLLAEQEKLNQLQQTVQQLTQQLSQKDDTVRKLEYQLDIAQQERATWQSTAEKDRPLLEQLRQETAQVQQACTQLQSECSQLKQERTQLASALEAATSIQKSAEAELDELRKALATKTTQAEQHVVDHQKLAGLYRSSLGQVKDLTATSKATQDQLSAEQAKTADLQLSVEKLTAQLAQKSDGTEKLQQQLDLAQQACAAAQHAQEQLNAQLEEREAQLSSLQSQLSQLSAEAKQSSLQRTASSRELSLRHEMTTKLQEELSQILDERAALQTVVREQQNQIDVLTQHLNDEMAAGNERTDLAVAEVQQQLKAAERDAENARHALKSRETELLSSITQLEQKLAATASLQTLQERLEDRQKKLMESRSNENAALRKLTSAEHALTELTVAQSQLQSQLSDIMTQLSETSEQLVAAQTERDEAVQLASDITQQLQSYYDVNSSLQQSVETLSDEKGDLLQQLEQALSDTLDLRRELLLLQSGIDERNTDISAKLSQLRQLDSANQELRSALDSTAITPRVDERVAQKAREFDAKYTAVEQQLVKEREQLSNVRSALDKERHRTSELTVEAEEAIAQIAADQESIIRTDDMLHDQLSSMSAVARAVTQSTQQLEASTSSRLSFYDKRLRQTTILLGKLKQRLEVVTWEQKAAEYARSGAEQDRSVAEQHVEEARADAIKARVMAEQAQAKAEHERSVAEQTRLEAEQERTVAEQARIEAEQQRAAAEKARAEGEQAQLVAEQARNEAEQARTVAEQFRADAELALAKLEKSFADAEQQRAQAELARSDAQQAREQAEQAQLEAQQARSDAEQDAKTRRLYCLGLSRMLVRLDAKADAAEETSKRVVHMNRRMSTTVDSNQLQIQQLEQENEEVRSELTDVQEQLRVANQQTHDLQLNVQKLEGNVQQLTHSNSEATHALDLLQEHLSTKQATYDTMRSDYLSLQGEFTGLSTDHTTLQKSHSDLESEHRQVLLQVSQLRHDLDLLHAEHMNLNKAFQECGQQQQDSHHNLTVMVDAHEQLTISHAAAVEKLDLVTRELDDLHAAYAALESDHEAVQTESSALQAQMAAVADELSLAQLQLQALTAANTELHSCLLSNEATISAARRALSDAAAQRNSAVVAICTLHQRESSCTALFLEYVKQSAVQQRLQKQSEARIAEMTGTIADLQLTAQSASETINALQSKCEVRLKEAIAIAQSASQERNQLSLQVSALGLTVKDLEAEKAVNAELLTELTAKARVAAVETAKTRRSSQQYQTLLSDELQTANAEKAKLAADLSLVQKELSVCKQTLADTQQQLRTLQQEHQQLQTVHETQVLSLTESVAQLHSQAESSQSEVLQCKAEIAKLQAENVVQVERAGSLQFSRELDQQQHTEAISSLQALLREQQTQLADARTRLTSLQEHADDNYEAVQQENQTLSQLLNDTRRAVKQTEKQLDACTVQMTQSLTMSDKMERSLQILRDRNSGLHEQLAAAEENVKAADRQVADLRSDNVRLTQQVARSKQQVKDAALSLRTELETAQQHLLSLEHQRETQAAEIVARDAVIRSLKHRLYAATLDSTDATGASSAIQSTVQSSFAGSAQRTVASAAPSAAPSATYTTEHVSIVSDILARSPTMNRSGSPTRKLAQGQTGRSAASTVARSSPADRMIRSKPGPFAKPDTSYARAIAARAISSSAQFKDVRGTEKHEENQSDVP